MLPVGWQVKEMKDVITRRHEDYIACLQRFLALKRGAWDFRPPSLLGYV
jgi:hypothetical protein